MTKEVQAYHCKNPACPLGSRKDAGRFTGGITSAQKNMLTGDPEENMVEGEDYGEGVCPTCGEKAELAEANEKQGESGTHDFASGNRKDPNQEIHDEVAARVEDEEDPLTTRGAQKEVIRAVKEREGEVEEEVDEDA